MKAKEGGSAVALAKTTQWEIEPRNKWVLIRKFVRTERKVGDVVQPGEGTPGFEARSQRGTVHLVLEEEVYARAVPCP